jgi:hypothetical protein
MIIGIGTSSYEVNVPDDFMEWDPAEQEKLVDEVMSSPGYLANPNTRDPLAPPTADIVAAREAAAPKPVQEPQYHSNWMEQGLSGFGEFAATGLGAPSDLLEGLVNAPATLIDIARQGGLRDDRPAPGAIDLPMGADDWQTRMRQDTIPGVVGPMIAREDPDYKVLRRATAILPGFLFPELAATRVTGPTRMAAGLAREGEAAMAASAGRAPGVPGPAFNIPIGSGGPAPVQLGRKVVSSGTAAGASAVGGEVGENVAEEARVETPWGTFSLPPELGQIIGEAAGGVTPSLARGVGEKVVKYALQDTTPTPRGPRSKQVYEAAIRSGIRPSVGMVGNQQAAQTENLVKATPFAGAGVERRVTKQVADTEASLARTVAPNYNPEGIGGPVVRRAEGDYAIGDRALSYLEPARAQISAELGRLQQTVFREMGGSTQAMPLAAFDRWYQQTRPTLDAVGKDLLDQLRTSLRRDIINNPANDIDRGLGQSLRGDLQAANNQLEALRAQPSPPAAQVRQLEDEARQIQDAIFRNLGVRADNLDMARSRIGAASATGPSLGNLVEGGAKRAVTDTMRDRVRTQGGDLNAFNRALDEKRRIASPETPLRVGGDKPFVEAHRRGKQEPAAFYRYLTAPEGVERLIAARRNMNPEQFDTLAADIIQDAATPTRVGTRSNTEDFSPSAFTKAWGNMAPEAKEVLFPNPVMRQQLDDVKVLSDAILRRSTAAAPAGNAATAVSAATWYNLIKNPGQAIPFVTGMGAVSSNLVDEVVTKILAEQYPFFFERLAQGAGRSGLAATINNGILGQEQ